MTYRDPRYNDELKDTPLPGRKFDPLAPRQRPDRWRYMWLGKGEPMEVKARLKTGGPE